MLVLTRKVGERIRIGQDIEMVIVSVRNDQVRVGFIAPRGIPICRSELLEEVRQENLEAARSASLMKNGGTRSSPGRRRGLKLQSGESDRENSAASPSCPHHQD